MNIEQNPTTPTPAESVQPRSMRFRLAASSRTLWLVSGLALGGDQLVKNVIVANLAPGESWPAEGFLRITHAWNTGAAFSLLRGQNDLLTVISLTAVILLGLSLRLSKNDSVIVRFGLALALGGALGNIVDRLRLGHVTDIFDVGPWPIFNTADSAIVIGLGLVIWKMWFATDKDKVEIPVEVPNRD